MQLGSRASQRYLFKLDPGAPPVEQVRRDDPQRAAGRDDRRFPRSRIPSSPTGWIRRPRF